MFAERWFRRAIPISPPHLLHLPSAVRAAVVPHEVGNVRAGLLHHLARILTQWDGTILLLTLRATYEHGNIAKFSRISVFIGLWSNEKKHPPRRTRRNEVAGLLQYKRWEESKRQTAGTIGGTTAANPCPRSEGGANCAADAELSVQTEPEEGHAGRRRRCMHKKAQTAMRKPVLGSGTTGVSR